MYLLNRYIRKQIILSTLTVMLIAAGIESFMEFVGQMSDLGVKSFGLWQAIVYVPLQLPADLYQLLPMIGFLGSLIGLGRLASGSELAVMRSSGVSILQITWAVIKASLWIILFASIIGEWVAPELQAKADQIKNASLGRLNWLSQSNNVWLRQGNLFVHADSVISASQIQNVSLFQFNDQDQLIKTIFATQGILENKRWVLRNVSETDLNQATVSSSHLAQLPINIALNTKSIMQTKKDADEETLWQLLKSIYYRKMSGLLTSSFEFSFWQRVIKPVTAVVLICLGIPFVFGSLRSQSNGTRILVGVLLGFLFYMLNNFFGRITLVYQLPPLLSAALPTMLFSCICVGLLWKIR